jgi:hypothetical protein
MPAYFEDKKSRQQQRKEVFGGLTEYFLRTVACYYII